MTEQERIDYIKNHNKKAIESLERLIEGAKDGDEASCILAVSFYELGKKLYKVLPLDAPEQLYEKTLIRGISNAMFMVANDINNSLEEHNVQH